MPTLPAPARGSTTPLTSDPLPQKLPPTSKTNADPPTAGDPDVANATRRPAFEEAARAGPLHDAGRPSLETPAL
jgi:hypothetical protein